MQRTTAANHGIWGSASSQFADNDSSGGSVTSISVDAAWGTKEADGDDAKDREAELDDLDQQ